MGDDAVAAGVPAHSHDDHDVVIDLDAGEVEATDELSRQSRNTARSSNGATSPSPVASATPSAEVAREKAIYW
jgi:hypothetical protein